MAEKTVEEKKEPTKTFRPRARLLQLLGDQLIRDPRIGVFELVKNAYDADSPSAQVRFRNVENVHIASIEINDEGEGMNFDTVADIWLEPGADNRQKQRFKGERTPLFKRLPIGEKGVGRFATHKLGNHISMVTRRRGFDEVVVEIDWDTLTTQFRYLSEAPVDVIERKPEVFKGNKHGTNIKITKLRNKWTRGDIRRLFRSINAISSPYEKQTGFTVDFKLSPDPGWLKGLLDARGVEDQAMFIYEFIIEGSQFDFKYEFRPMEALKLKKGVEPRELEKENQLLEYFQMKLNEDGKRVKRTEKANLSKFGVGPIKGKILGFDRDREIMNLYITDPSGLQEYLDENGGVRVYRDGIRVYNYGEHETDWLGLDERRIQIPTRRISNNLILGEIHLDLEKSPELVEKTNREGFVENEAYHEFRSAVLSAIIRFEQEREKDKHKIRLALEKAEAKDAKFPVISGPEEAISALKEKVREIGMDKELGKYVSKVESTYIEMRDSLLGAVGSGLGLTIVFHEIERGVRDLHRAIDKGDKIERIEVMAHHLVELLQGVSYLVRTTSRKTHNASDIVKYALFSMSPRFDYHRVLVSNGFSDTHDEDFNIKGSQRMLTASLVNLIDNSIYWINVLRGTPDGKGRGVPKRIWIGPSRDLEGPSIVIADNGPGFEDAPEDLVRPFFTRKPDGMGLGLYFANMAMKAHGGRLAFPERNEIHVPKAYNGAVIAMVFKEK